MIDDGTGKRIGIGIDVSEHELLTQELRRREIFLAEAQQLSHTGALGGNLKVGRLSDRMKPTASSNMILRRKSRLRWPGNEFIPKIGIW
jgi:hypothetical protein